MSDVERVEWEMPPWMEPYREHMVNTGGNTVERLMDVYLNQPRVLTINLPLGVLAIACACQVDLLHRLRRMNMLPEPGGGADE